MKKFLDAIRPSADARCAYCIQVLYRPPKKEVEMDEKQIAVWVHLSAFAGLIIPFGNIIAPLIIWLVNKDKSAYANEQGKEALNFQITMGILFIISLILMVIVIGALLAIAVGIFDVVMIVIAAVKVSKGEEFKYPISFRLIK